MLLITQYGGGYKMIEMLEKLNGMGWFNVILTLALVIILIPLAIDSWKKFKSSIGLKSVDEIEDENNKKDIIQIKEDIRNLEHRFDRYCKDHEEDCAKWRGQSVEIRNDLKKDIKSLMEKFDTYIEMDNKRTIATLRTSLWRMHKEFIEQKYVTPDGLKTFLEMGKVYEQAGGNDVYHEKLKPEVEALDIHYPNGSIYHHSE